MFRIQDATAYLEVKDDHTVDHATCGTDASDITKRDTGKGSIEKKRQ